MESFFQSHIADPKNFANIFTQQDPDVNNWRALEKPNDVIVVDNKLDLLLSRLTDNQILSPFDFNNYSDAFSRFAKLREDEPDWRYHLEKL